MKWNDIKKHFAQMNDQASKTLNAVSGKKSSTNINATTKHHRITHWILLALVVITVAIGIIALIKVFSKKQATPILPVEELKSISTFLDENPPKPLTASESATVTDVLNKPVQLNSDDLQAVNSFMKK